MSQTVHKEPNIFYWKPVLYGPWYENTFLPTVKKQKRSLRSLGLAPYLVRHTGITRTYVERDQGIRRASSDALLVGNQLAPLTTDIALLVES